MRIIIQIFDKDYRFWLSSNPFELKHLSDFLKIFLSTFLNKINSLQIIEINQNNKKQISYDIKNLICYLFDINPEIIPYFEKYTHLCTSVIPQRLINLDSTLKYVKRSDTLLSYVTS